MMRHRPALNAGLERARAQIDREMAALRVSIEAHVALLRQELRIAQAELADALATLDRARAAPQRPMRLH